MWFLCCDFSDFVVTFLVLLQLFRFCCNFSGFVATFPFLLQLPVFVATFPISLQLCMLSPLCNGEMGSGLTFV
jgi:hypothetical protein